MRHASSNPTELAKQMVWLAFQAAVPVGMGRMHAESASAADIVDVWRVTYSPSRNEVQADYVFGRMTKLFIRINEADGYIEHSESTPHPEYQSWCRRYPTYADLIVAASAAIGVG